MTTPNLTAEQAKALFDYDPKTGELRNRISRHRRAKAGELAGSRKRDGYLRVKVEYRDYLVHRIAWLLTYGVWPTLEIDHINCVRDDNRIANLREATCSENRCNRGAQADNTTGFKGVTWDKARGKLKAHIKIHGAITNLGRFSTAEAAAEAYNRAATATHGPFANLGTAA